MSLCEIRVTTYKRPDLLNRALTTLQEQTYKNWQAIVLDDSPEQEGKAVVESFNTEKIIYKPHKTNLGRAKNLDYAFSSSSYIDGTYAFVLEDDNYLFPDFIAENIEVLEANKVNIVERNQEIRIEKNGISTQTNTTSRSQWFKEGIYSPYEIYNRLFFCEGITNGGLFWRTDKIKSNLQVGSQVEDALHQELFRTLKIKEPVYFAMTPKCVFTRFYDEEQKRKAFTVRRRLHQIKYNRGIQSIMIYLIKKYGKPIIQEAQKIALETGNEYHLEHKLLEALYLDYEFKHFNNFQAVNARFRHYIRYLMLKDPYRDFLVSFS